MELEAPHSSTSRAKAWPKEDGMRLSLVGAFVVAVLVMAASAGTGSSEPAYGPPVNYPAAGQAAELIAHVTAAEGQPQIVTVVDPRSRVMAVYHVDRTTGQITPKSVRNITWDLQMIEFNSGDPLPQDIRSGLQR
jgi:anti-sigma-K factor RskA